MDFCLLLCLISLFSLLTVGDSSNITCPVQLIQFGDSISDTGNAPLAGPVHGPITNMPYGRTFPGRPDGRASDGRLIVDYIAPALGLPLLRPYLEKNASFKKGVNFAVSGATAVNLSFYASMGIILPSYSFSSLDTQIQWFHTLLASICSFPKGCGDKLNRTLAIVGEFGINDIKGQLMAGKSIDEITPNVPYIIQATTRAIKELIRVGVKRLVIPGNFPIGCFPFGLSALPSKDPNSYDGLDCLKSLNDLVIYQNTLLHDALVPLRSEFPDATIVYADYYNAFLTVFKLSGFDSNSLLKPCCGTNDFNISSPRFCGNPGVPVCLKPEKYISWDGVHLTQEAYRRISEIIIPRYILPATTTICLPQAGSS